MGTILKKMLCITFVLSLFGSIAYGYGYTEVGDSNLIAWLKFDEGSGSSAADSSGNSHTGTLYNMEAGDWVAGKDGYALDFGGTNEYVQITDSAQLDLSTHDFSYVMWIKKNAAGSRQAILSQRYDGSNWHQIEWQTDNTIRVWTKVGGTERIKFDSATALSANTWYHVAIVVDRDSAANTKIYIDGEDDTEGTPTVSTVDCSIAGNIQIARNAGDASIYWVGVIDGVHQYNDKLTEDEISDLYNKDINLVAWLKFNEGSGSSAVDSTGNGHTGTLNNMEAGDWVAGKDGDALDFGGTDEYVQITDSAQLDLGTGDFSYVMWIKKDAAGSRQAILSQRYDGSNWHQIEWQTDNTIRVWTKIGGTERIRFDSATALSANTWYLVAIVVDRDSAANTKIYINGVNDTEGTPTVSTVDCSIAGNIQVARNAGDGSIYWVGVIDDIHQYNDKLTEAEISDLYTEAENPIRLVCEDRRIVDGNGTQIRLRGLVVHGQENITAENIADLKSWGCNFLRVLMPYDSAYWCTVNGCVEDAAYRGVMREEDLAIMDDIADWCESNQMYWIFGLQPTYMGFEFDLLQYAPTDPDLFADQMETIGQTIGDRYKNYNYLVGYEPFGEPVSIDTSTEYAAYKQICEAFTDGVRAYDLRRMISIATLNYAHPSYMPSAIKLDRSNIVYAISYYPCRPFVSYQSWYGDFRYPGSIPDFYENEVVWLDYEWYWTYGLDDGVSTSESWNVPIYCHEFGAWGNNEWNGTAPDNSTERSMKDMTYLFENNNINWAIWRWQEAATDVPAWWKSLWDDGPVNNRVQIEPHGGTFVGSVSVTMQTFVDGGSIYYTTDGTEPDTGDTLYSGAIDVTSDTTLCAKVFKAGLSDQPNDIAVFDIGGRDPNTLANIADGLRYWYYEGEWNTAPNFETLNAEANGTCLTLDSTLGAETDGKALMWKGYINITTGDIYYFDTRVENSGALEIYVGDQRVIMNGTAAGSTYSVGMIPLKAGRHPFKVCYTRPTGTGSLFDIEIQSPSDSTFVDLGASYLDYDNSAPGQASTPSPANSVTDVARNADLWWTEGKDAVSHDFYFGTSNPPPFVGSQSGSMYNPGTMNASTTYYWRVNEKNTLGTVTGPVWQFTTGTTTSLSGLWDFEEGSGSDAEDSSIWGNDGELKNMAAGAWVGGEVGSYALDFDGLDDYVLVPTNYKLNLGTGDFSFSMWVNKDVTGTRSFLLNQRASGYNWYAMEWDENDHIVAYGKTLNVEHVHLQNNTALSADTWYHVAVVFDRDSAANSKIYINNVDDTNTVSRTVDADDMSLNSDFNIGRWSGGGYYFDGTIDDIRFYDWALSVSEVDDLYDMGL